MTDTELDCIRGDAKDAESLFPDCLFLCACYVLIRKYIYIYLLEGSKALVGRIHIVLVDLIC